MKMLQTFKGWSYSALSDARKILLALMFFMVGTSAVFAQRTVTGSVNGPDQAPLVGVSIIAKGTTAGAITGIDGNYSLSLPSDVKTLLFTFVGMESKEVTIGSGNIYNVTLTESLVGLDEVVVVGYGEQSRSRMTTSVSKVDNRVLESAPRSNVGTALQGTVAGLQVQNISGQPGITPSILLRGGTDWSGGSAPLVVVNGIVSSLSGLNANDIESMDVLKDAGATAIYGARAANGVILISTKKGKAGKSQINYTYKFGMNNRRIGYDYLHARDYIYYNRIGLMRYKETTGKTDYDYYAISPSIGWGTGGNMTNSIMTTQRVTTANRQYLNDSEWQWLEDPYTPGDTILFQDTKMSELYFQDSYVHDHHLSFSGGNDKALYSLGLGYMYDRGIVLASELKRFTVDWNSSYYLYKNLKMSSSINFASSSPKGTYIGDYRYIFERAIALAPTSRIYNADGSLNPGNNSSLGNALYYVDKFIRKNLEHRITASVALDWNLLPELKFTVRGGLFTYHNLSEGFEKAYLNKGSMVTSRIASGNYSRNISQQYNALLKYDKTFGAEHNVSLLLGEEFYTYNSFNMGAFTKNSPTDLIYTMNAGSEASGVPFSTFTSNRILSTLGRISYNFDSRYLLNFNFRYDGSSKLANNKWGFFPGVSVGWNLHNESFFRDLSFSKFISSIKPRLSYGVNGNVDNLSDFEVFGGYSLTAIYNKQKGYFNNSLPLLNLKWESSTTLNMGVDFGFLNDRVSLLVDYFIRDVKNKLSPYTLPYETGFSSVTTNNGILRNRGLELEMRANVLNRGLRWDIGANFYTIKNFVIKLPENGLENNRQGGQQIYDPKAGKVVWVGGLQEGKRIGTDEIYLLAQDYVYADAEEVAEHATRIDMYFPASQRTNRYPGDVAWRDVDKNDTIDYRDMVLIGRSTPVVMGGFTSQLTWKGLSLFVKTDYALGHWILNSQRQNGMAQGQGSANSTTELLKSWMPDNTHTDVARFVFVDGSHNVYLNSRYYEKGDYICLREVTLSYNIPTQIFNSYLKELKIYFTGANLVYLTQYGGTSPEVGGLDDGRYPIPRVYTFGLSATF